MGLISLRNRFTDYERFHWRQFNRMNRIFGLLLVLFGFVFLAWGFYFVLNPDSPIDRGGSVITYFAIGGFTLSLGVAFVRVKAFRPDLGDSYFGWLRDVHNANRSWWTGEPRREE